MCRKSFGLVGDLTRKMRQVQRQAKRGPENHSVSHSNSQLLNPVIGLAAAQF